jgi:hypothetical protein
MEVSGQLHAPAALPQGKSSWYPLDRRLGGPQSQPGRGGEEKNSHLSPSRDSNPQLKRPGREADYSSPPSAEVRLQTKYS